MKAPIFDRVTSIRYRAKDLQDMPLEREDIAQLDELEHLDLAKYDSVVEADILSITDRVPSCRLNSVSAKGKKLTVKVDVSLRSCSAN